MLHKHRIDAGEKAKYDGNDIVRDTGDPQGDHGVHCEHCDAERCVEVTDQFKKAELRVHFSGLIKGRECGRQMDCGLRQAT